MSTTNPIVYDDGLITIPNIADTVEGLANENWTRVVEQIEDPANRSYVVSMGMLMCLGLTLYGHQLIKLWLFLGGFVSVAAAFYIFAPSAFETDICCGPGTEKAHVIISLCLGVVAGVVCLWILNIGIFLCGTCFGLGVAITSRTFLAQLHVFQTQEQFAMFYVGCALAGGIFALYKERPIIICVTSFGGAFGFFVGVGYFEQCHFWKFAVFAEHEVAGSGHTESLGESDSLPECVLLLASLYVILAIIGILVQCRLVCRRSNEDSSGKLTETRAKNGGALGRYSHVDDIELREMLVKSYIKNEARKRNKRSRRKRVAVEKLIESLSDGDSDKEKKAFLPKSRQRVEGTPGRRKGLRDSFRRKPKVKVERGRGGSTSSSES